MYGCEPYIQFSTEELFCIVNGRLEAKAIYHQHSWWVLKGSCIFATPFLLYKNRGDELTSSVFIVMHIKIGTIFKTPILRVPFTQVHPHISVWGWIVF